MRPMVRKNRRISARLTPQAYRMVEEMSVQTGRSISNVLERSIVSYHHRLKGGRKQPWKLLWETGLIGVSRGDPKLSTNYKTMLTKSLTRKLRGPM